MRKKSPVKDTPCLYCGRLFTQKGVSEHERHACPLNPNRRKRSFGKARCKVCGELFHQNGLRSHMATQHPIEFARDQANRKPTSRAAKRRELMKRHSGAHRAKQRDAHDTKRSAASRESARPRNDLSPSVAQQTARTRKEHKERPAAENAKPHPKVFADRPGPRHPDAGDRRPNHKVRVTDRLDPRHPETRGEQRSQREPWAEAMRREMAQSAARLSRKVSGPTKVM